MRNCNLLESVLSSNHGAINNHAVCEEAVAGILKVFKEGTFFPDDEMVGSINVQHCNSNTRFPLVTSI